MALRTTHLILASLVLGFADAPVAHFFYPGELLAPSSFAIVVVVLFLTFLWYRRDSDLRGYKRSPLLSIGMIGLTIVALPYYLFRTRGVRGGALGTIGVIVIALGYSAMGFLGRLAVRALRT